MAVTLGTNAGFVTVAPTADPEGATVRAIDVRYRALKVVVPAGALTISKIMWWCSGDSEEANWEAGLYAHNSGADAPAAMIGTKSGTNAKGTTAGWKTATVDITLPAAGTTVWIAVQVDDTATTTNMDYVSDAGHRASLVTTVSTLPDPHASGTFTADLLAICAVYTTASGGMLFESSNLYGGMSYMDGGIGG